MDDKLIHGVPEWALRRAMEKMNSVKELMYQYQLDFENTESIRRDIYPHLFVIAELISKCEEPPVDPLEMKVRETYVKVSRGHISDNRANEILKNGWDVNIARFAWNCCRVSLGMNMIDSNGKEIKEIRDVN